MRLRISWLIVTALLVSASARAVPSLVYFQGAVSSAGAPINGTAAFKFAVLDAAGDTLWSNDGTTSGEPATAVTLPVNKGLFSAPLGDPALGFAALPLTTFDTDALIRVWVSRNGGAFQQQTPDIPLGTVPYAAVADSATSSTNAARLGGLPSSSYARAAFVTGFTSGLPAGSAMNPVDLTASSPGYFTGPAGVFAGLSVSYTLDTSNVRTTNLAACDLTLRRPLGPDRSWETISRTGRHAPRADLSLSIGGIAAVSWSLSNVVALHYALRIGDDGYPVEEMTLRAVGITRTQTSGLAGTTPTLGPPVGFNAGAAATLQPQIDGVSYPSYLFVSGGVTIAPPTGVGGTSKPKVDPFMLRVNPTDGYVAATSSSVLWAWFLGNTRHTFSMAGDNGTPFTAYTLNSAFAYTYALRLADDGLPVEEYGISGTLPN